MAKKGQLWDTLTPWIIGIAIMLLVFVLYTVFYDKGSSVIDFFKNLVRFR